MMEQAALILSETACSRLPEILHQAGIQVEPHPDLGPFKMLRCRRGKATVLLSMMMPEHWAETGDERKDKVVVAAIAASLWRFWRLPADNRLKSEIMALLAPHAWTPHRPEPGMK
jgi:hypothetical protein